MKWVCLFLLCAASAFGDAGYVGPEVCGACHPSIYKEQRKTAMAGTWQMETALGLAAGYDESVHERAVSYRVRRSSHGFSFETKLPGAPAVTLPVEGMVGGIRHGISFLTRIDQLAGIPLPRPALIEGRYAFSSPLRRLIISPGFPAEQPQNYETAFGNVLSPGFEKKCLLCHGQPDQAAASARGGVGCESCHGPGLAHTKAVSKSDRIAALVKPSMEVCAQCHTGFNYLADPLPDDLLISSQVTALQNSECFLQSKGAVGCTNCHDPHRQQTSEQTLAASETTCRGCHSGAAACSSNRKDGCIGCHMPAIQKGEFAMVDHWIRVHPEQGAPTSHATAQRPSQEFLRIIVAASRENADAAKARLTQGEDFFDVAARVSIDASRDTGGFIGRATLADLDPRLADAAARLHYGQTSEILELPDRWMIVQRLPRDFRMDAQRLFLQAVDLKAKGNVRGALERDQAALKWNPSFLRALIFMGATLGESGQLQRAQNVLTVATQLFPKDSAALFNLGIVLGGLGKTDAQIQAFRHAIELDPDNVAVYESLGAALHAVGDSPGALETFRQGLQIDPLSAALNFDLSLELQQQGDQPSALQAKQLALRINPQLVPTVGK